MTEPDDPYLPEQDGDDALKTPFTFKLMIVLVVLYLGWRLIQGVIWLFDWIRG